MAVIFSMGCFHERVIDLQDSVPNRTDITITIPLTTASPLPTFPVYAFLPVRNVGFNFLLNG